MLSGSRVNTAGLTVGGGGLLKRCNFSETSWGDAGYSPQREMFPNYPPTKRIMNRNLLASLTVALLAGGLAFNA